MDLIAVAGRTLAHPIRRSVLAELGLVEDAVDHPPTAGARSPTELARILKEPLGNVSYHVRELVAAELLHLVSTEPRRGAVEHYYGLTDRGRDILAVMEALEHPAGARAFLADVLAAA